MLAKKILKTTMEFFSKFSLVKLLQGAVVYLIVTFVLSSIKLSDSQLEGMLEDNVTNESTLHPVCFKENLVCSQLEAVCVTCHFFHGLPQCVYNKRTNFSCWPKKGVVCEGDRNFSRTFPCRYCYQTGEDEQCCTPNDSCDVRGTPSSTYIASCTVNTDVYCLPPRTFRKVRQCNYSKGKRWTTAFLLSITLGGFGVDRFYLAHWGAGVGKLLSFGGLGVWSILDVILVGTGYLAPADGSAYIY